MTTTLPSGTLDERSGAVKAVRVYLRQSKSEEKQAESVPTQRAECERLARSLGIRPGQWERRQEYVDVDRAGDDSTREHLARLLREAQEGDVILAWKQDRVGRDMIDSAAAIRELVKYRKCDLFTVETGTVRVALDSAEQTAMVMFRGMVAQGELERIRSRTRDGLRQRARDGFATGSVPFGYRTVLVDPNVTDRKKSKKRIEIDDGLAPIVSRIFEMYVDGRGYAAIAKALNREGAPSPNGRGWAPSSIWPMLRETRYAGEWTHGRKRVVRREGKRVIKEYAPESEVVRTQRPELAIVPPELWARVQAALAARKREGMKAQLVASSWASVHMLSGTLKCGVCGGPLRIQTSSSPRTTWSRRYYVCPNKRSGRCASSTWLPADQAEQKLIDYLVGSVLGQMEQSIRDAIRGEVRRVVETANARTGEADQIRAEVESLKRERQRLVRLAAVTDDPVPEVADALCANHQRAKALGDALVVATLPPIDPALAERLEAAAVAQVQRMREKLTSGEAKEALTILFPAGLRFKVASGLWKIEGAASVPTIRSPDEARSQRGDGRDS